jgi:hypothetical protein
MTAADEDARPDDRRAPRTGEDPAMTGYEPLIARIAGRARDDAPMMPLPGLPHPLSPEQISQASLYLGYRNDGAGTERALTCRRW